MKVIKSYQIKGYLGNFEVDLMANVTPNSAGVLGIDNDGIFIEPCHINSSNLYATNNFIVENYAKLRKDFIKAYKKINKEDTTDTVVDEVIESLKSRSKVGIDKYGTTLDRDDLSIIDWVQHAIEEAQDLTLYLTKIKKMLNDRATGTNKED